MLVETSPALVQYYAAVDANDFETAMALMAPDVTFAILLPARVVRGNGRQGLVDYLSGRGDVVRRHVPQRASVEGDLQFVYGAVVEDDTTVTGHFLAAAHVGEDGLITGYQVAFDPELGLLAD
jgi:hypothetical protein